MEHLFYGTMHVSLLETSSGCCVVGTIIKLILQMRNLTFTHGEHFLQVFTAAKQQGKNLSPNLSANLMLLSIILVSLVPSGVVLPAFGGQA